MTTRGASLIEVLIALTILSIGILGIAGTGASVTRMLASGRRTTVISSYAAQRLEKLRASISDSTGCGALTNGSGALPGGFSEQWSVVSGVRSAVLEVIVTPASGAADTIGSVVFCP